MVRSPLRGSDIYERSRLGLK